MIVRAGNNFIDIKTGDRVSTIQDLEQILFLSPIVFMAYKQDPSSAIAWYIANLERDKYIPKEPQPEAVYIEIEQPRQEPKPTPAPDWSFYDTYLEFESLEVEE